MMKDNDFWKNYYNDSNRVKNKNPQINVGRTNKSIPIDNSTWERTILDIKKVLGLNGTQDVLELCCGNGTVIGELSQSCRTSIGVDFSSELIRQLNEKYKNEVTTLLSDVKEVSFYENSLDVVIIYFSIQHFSEKETLELIGKSLRWLRKGGLIFIGDVPDELKKWEYIDLPKYRKDFFTRMLNDEPMIGNWFQSNFFKAMESFYLNIKVDVINQPDYQINSSYRFDVIIKKN